MHKTPNLCLEIKILFFLTIAFSLFSSKHLHAQQFMEQTAFYISGKAHSSVSWGDYDNDGYLDILLTGRSSFTYTSKVYRNNGDGSFSAQESISLTSVYDGASSWGDFNNDGYLDILLTGYNGVSSIVKTYRNNGDGTFSEQTSITIPDTYYTSATWADNDCDGYIDILLTCSSGIKIYRNNKNGNFIEQTPIPLSDFSNSSSAWADFNKDGYLDILITGINFFRAYETKLYKNNGNGTFTEQKSALPSGVSSGSISWGDYNNDGFPDILMSGQFTSGLVSKIYKNNGNGTFSELSSASLAGVYYSASAWGDYDNDGLQDILITGATGNLSDPKPVSKVYRNNGDGTFRELVSASLTGIFYGSVAWADYDNDGNLDILLSGKNNNTVDDCVAKVYRNFNPVHNSLPAAPSNLQTSINGNRVIFNWNKSTDKETPQDGLNYNLAIGTSPNAMNTLSPMSDRSSGFRRVVRPGNSQSGNSVNLSLPAGTYYWSVQAIDGAYAGSKFALENSFTIQPSVTITSPNGGENWTAATKHNITWISQNVDSIKIEYTTDNGTNWQTVVSAAPAQNGNYLWIVPYTASDKYKVKLSNAANPNSFDESDNTFTVIGLFSEQNLISLPGVENGTAVWGDYDNDGDLDILLSGDVTGGSGRISKIFMNNGNGKFIEQTSISLEGVIYGSSAWGDYDNDGNPDILITGFGNTNPISKVYRNNGNGTFSEQTSISLTGVQHGSVAWGDYDNDGNSDILLTGQSGNSSNSIPISKIYRNNGNGCFSEQTSIPLSGVYNSFVAWGDYDRDGFLDILLTGNTGNGYISRIYRNNGNGNFIEQTFVSLVALAFGSAAWGDYDKDGYPDILLTGRDNSWKPFSKIYRNNGNGTFSEQTSISLAGVYNSSVAWGDYDNDGNLDILLTGDSSTGRACKIYSNNGNGSFSDQTSIVLPAVNYSSAAWGDYDNDGRLDILLTGQDGSPALISKIYKNNISAANSVPLAPVNLTTTTNGNRVTFSWNKSTDNETPQDGLNYNLFIGNTANSFNILSPMSDISSGYRKVVRPGKEQANSSVTYKLPGGTYYWSVQAIDAAYAGSKFASVKSFMIQPSITLTSPNGGESWITGTKQYITWISQNVANVKIEYLTDNLNWTTIVASTPATSGSYLWTVPGSLSDKCEIRISDVSDSSSFDLSDNLFSIANLISEQKSILLTGVINSSVAWGDYDNDGDLDILLTGLAGISSSNSKPVSKIYRNDGNNVFTEQTSISLTGVYSGSSTWGDYNNDGYLDILLTGKNSSSSSVTKLYRNNGNGTFTEETSSALDGIYNSSVAWGDYNKDGYLDILLTGRSNSNNQSVARVYKNNGSGGFTALSSTSLKAVFGGSAIWGDFNNDGYPDILLTGQDDNYNFLSRIYKNNGDGTFSEQTSILLTGLTSSSAAWGDYNNDGYLDILLTGTSVSGSYLSSVYKNNGNGTFSLQTSISLRGVYYSSAAWGDYDNDGYIDILLTGNSSIGTISRIYKNNGNGTFSEQTSIVLDGVYYGSAAFGDYDNNGTLDILLTGSNGSSAISKIYRNNTPKLNSIPNSPDNLEATVNGNKVTFSWNKSTDNETSQNGLSYNLVVGTASNAANVVTPLSDRLAGYRRVVRYGNSQTNNAAYYLPAGTYYWSVQAIDGSFAGSRFSSEKTFTITPSIKVLSPSGGEKWIAGTKQNISWTNNNVNDIKIEYSIDDGATWLIISASTPALSSSYSWTVPNTPSKKCRVRLSNIANLNSLAVSEGVFTIISLFEEVPVTLAGVQYGNLAWGDYNNDGNLDVLLSGQTLGSNISKIYMNNGDGTFTEQTSIALTGTIYGASSWGDYDNDGYLDVLILNSQKVLIYKNNGKGGFNTPITITLEGISGSTIVWGDYNNDGRLDFLLLGSTDPWTSATWLYRNNGDGSFSHLTSAKYEGVNLGSAAWGDFDNDGDQDVLLTGSSKSNQSISKIYKNNGDGSFSEQTAISLPQVDRSSVALGDYDNDGYLDILLTGYATSYSGTNAISRVYRNNRDWSFSEQTSVILTTVGYSSVAWGDYDNDGYLDILLTGRYGWDDVSKVYHNNGNGSFSELTSITLTGVQEGSAAWGDYDNDGDLDILLTGIDSNSNRLSKIYKNNNPVSNSVPTAPVNLKTAINGNNITFSWDKSTDNQTPQDGLNYNLVIGTSSGGVNCLSPLSDISSGHRRVVRPGSSQTNNSANYNLPAGKYFWSVQAIDGAFAGSKFAEEKTFTISAPELKITSPNGGENWLSGTQQKITWISNNITNIKIEYTTDDGLNWSTIVASIPASSSSYNWVLPYVSSNKCRIRISDILNISDISDTSFTIIGLFEPQAVNLTNVHVGSVAWGDFDNDGDLDILLSGQVSKAPPVTRIYRNDGNGIFTEQTSINLIGVLNSSVAWGDYNNDGYLDILLTGLKSEDPNNPKVSKIYRNNGNGTFTEETSAVLTCVSNGSVAWGDYNNDGYQDILLTGNTGSGYVSKIYKNNGNGTFTDQTSFPIAGVYNSSVAWGDYDNDGYLDFLLTGQFSTGPISKIYRNNGNGTFSEQTSVILPGVMYSSVAWGDYDNDGFLDILLTGAGIGPAYIRISKIFRNTGNGTFTEQASLEGVKNGSVAWGDYDNDGNLDILLTGEGDGIQVSKIYRNNGNGSFSELTSDIPVVVSNSSAAWGDYDNDGDLDILLTGISGYYEDGKIISTIYKNNKNNANTLPTVPDKLSAVNNGNRVTFSWNKSTDKETPQNGLSYNLVIGVKSNSGNIVSPMSDISSGYRRVVRLGNSRTNNFFLKDLPQGTYYWSVQSIDGSFTGSAFAPEKSFSLSSTSLTLTSPTGGEKYQINTLQEIDWKSDNTIKNIRLDYSTNSGESWTLVASAVPGSAGKYLWTVPATASEKCQIKITSEEDQKTTSISGIFTIFIQLKAPGMQSPLNNELVQTTTLLKWSKCLQAERYHLQIARDSLFSDMLIEDPALTDTTKNIAQLANDTKYYWRIKAVNTGGESPWSVVWSFRVVKRIPPAVYLWDPEDGSIDRPVNVVLKWIPLRLYPTGSLTDYYHIQFSEAQDFRLLLINDSTLVDTMKAVSSLKNNTKYYWRVRAINNGGVGPWSEQWSFTTIALVPGAPDLISPANAEKNVPVNAKVTWAQVPGAQSYTMQLAEDSIFDKLTLNVYSFPSTTYDVKSLKTGMQYFWRVGANNSAGKGPYSKVRNFITVLPACDSLFVINQAVNKVKLAWIDRCDNEDGFIIERKADKDFTFVPIYTLKPNMTSYIDSTVVTNTQYKYRIKVYSRYAISDYSNEASVTTITAVKENNVIPSEFVLMQNYPNPFNPVTIIKYGLQTESLVIVKVYNSIGKVVSELVNSVQCAGFHDVSVNASEISSGVYYYSLEARATNRSKEYKNIRKMVILK